MVFCLLNIYVLDIHNYQSQNIFVTFKYIFYLRMKLGKTQEESQSNPVNNKNNMNLSFFKAKHISSYDSYDINKFDTQQNLQDVQSCENLISEDRLDQFDPQNLKKQSNKIIYPERERPLGSKQKSQKKYSENDFDFDIKQEEIFLSEPSIEIKEEHEIKEEYEIKDYYDSCDFKEFIQLRQNQKKNPQKTQESIYDKIEYPNQYQQIISQESLDPNNFGDQPDYEKKTLQTKSSRGSYTIHQEDIKEKVIQMIKEGMTIKKVAKLTGMNEKNITRWRKTGAKRKKGAGRKILDQEMELELQQWWINEIKEKGTLIPLSVIKKRARIKSKFAGKFKASKGWLDKFIKRYKIQDQIESIQKTQELKEKKHYVSTEQLIKPKRKNSKQNQPAKPQNIFVEHQEKKQTDFKYHDYTQNTTIKETDIIEDRKKRIKFFQS